MKYIKDSSISFI